MPRKPSALAQPAAEVVSIPDAAFAQLDQSAQALAAQPAKGAERDLLNQLLGQAQMANAFEQFSRTVRTSKLAYVKETKLYQRLKGQITPHGAELSGTWEEFCNLLGRSVDQVDRDIANLKAFGEEALESMSSMGIGYRELRQYRRLPADQKQALIEAARGGDKEGFLDLAEELIARHAREKEDMQRQLQDVQGKVAAREQLIEAKDKKLNQWRLAAERFGAPGAEGQAAVQERLARLCGEAQALVAGAMRQGFITLLEKHSGQKQAARDLMAGMVGELRRELLALQEEFNLADVVGDGRPEWQRGAEDMEAQDMQASA